MNKDFELQVVSCHDKFKNKIMKKHYVDGVETVGVLNLENIFSLIGRLCILGKEPFQMVGDGLLDYLEIRIDKRKYLMNLDDKFKYI